MMRMGRLVPGLVGEFGGELTDEEIRQIAHEILDTYDEVLAARTAVLGIDPDAIPNQR
jgi:hypothetical protein